jgi:membrane-anchored protein YejM (alkaline phosphatase superfamily)
MILTETPRRKLVTQLVNWGHWFALLNIIIAITIAAVYILTSPAPETALGTVYLFTNWVSHIGFLTFFGFVIFVLPLCYMVKNAKVVKAISSTLAAIALALLAFDALLYNKYGVHLSFGSAELIRSEAQTAIAEFGWQQWGFLLLLFVVWLSFQLIVANALWQRIERLQRRKLGMPITTFFVACFVTSHAMHIWADANLYQPIVQQDDMFPLSYPATAKTLMARYSLLDIQNYQQRKELQFDQSIQGINYPTSPVYCAVKQDPKVLLLLQTDMPINSNASIETLKSYSKHYALNSTLASAQLSALFGLPELYHRALDNKVPLMLDIPQKIGLKVAVYSEQTFEHSKISTFVTDWTQFTDELQSASTNLAIGFVTQQQITQIVSPELLANYKIIIANLFDADETNSRLLSNIPLNNMVSSTEDFPATLLNVMGCKAESNAYSTGQSMTKVGGREWLVSTQGSKVIVLHKNKRIEVKSNGSAKVFDLNSGEELVIPINTNVLSQAIKRLSSFSNTQ